MPSIAPQTLACYVAASERADIIDYGIRAVRAIANRHRSDLPYGGTRGFSAALHAQRLRAVLELGWVTRSDLERLEASGGQLRGPPVSLTLIDRLAGRDGAAALKGAREYAKRLKPAARDRVQEVMPLAA